MAAIAPPSVRSLLARRAPLATAAAQRAMLDALPLATTFGQALAASGQAPLTPTGIETFQVNVGKLCNQACRHCHVDAGPDRREVMSTETMEECLVALAATDIPTVDITGGAPELWPHFRAFVARCRALGRHVINRCNLTVLETAAHRDLPGFFARNRVEVVCSLPHWRALATDRQRGAGVHEASIAALRRLNDAGYGAGDPARRLVLVTNPVGAFLPGAQAALEVEWKRELASAHGVRFDALYTITNLPIARFLEWLVDSDNLEDYMARLVAAYNPAAAAGAMCRNTISVGWDGRLFDCDFNQMLELGVAAGAPAHVRDFARAALERRAIVTGPHCFGCAAGAGSSCGGTTA